MGRELTSTVCVVPCNFSAVVVPMYNVQFLAVWHSNSGCTISVLSAISKGI